MTAARRWLTRADARAGIMPRRTQTTHVHTRTQTHSRHYHRPPTLPLHDDDADDNVGRGRTAERLRVDPLLARCEHAAAPGTK
jgi:hypothetical protein